MNKHISLAGDIGYIKGVLEGIALQTDGVVHDCSKKALLSMERIEKELGYFIGIDRGKPGGDFTATTVIDANGQVLSSRVECYGCSTGASCTGGKSCLSNAP